MKYLLPILITLLFAGSVSAVTVFQIQQGGTNNGSAPSDNSLIWYNGSQYTATTSSPLTIGSFVATTTATSTAVNGIDISGGCFAVSGTCVTGGGAGTPGGSDGQVQYNNGGSFGGGTAFIWDDVNSYLGIGTTTPGSLLSLNGISNFTAATSTFYGTGGINLTGGCFAVSGACITGGGGSSPWTDNGDYLSPTNDEFLDVTYYIATSTNATSTFMGDFQWGEFDTHYSTTTNGLYVDNLFMGPQLFDTDAGIVSWIDMPVSSSAADNTIMSYTASLDGNPFITLSGQADGSGDIDTKRWGFGTGTPAFAGFTFTEGTGATTTINWGGTGDSTSQTCVNMKTNTGGDVSWYIVGTTMVIESNVCQ